VVGVLERVNQCSAAIRPQDAFLKPDPPLAELAVERRTICLDLVARDKDRCDILGCHSAVIGKRTKSSDRVWEGLKWPVL
jgi:hypothetical protein